MDYTIDTSPSITCAPSAPTTSPSYAYTIGGGSFDPQPHWSFTDIAGPISVGLILAFVVAWISYQIRAYNEVAIREDETTRRTALDKGFEQSQLKGHSGWIWTKRGK